jgi:hypothetical protein
VLLVSATWAGCLDASDTAEMTIVLAWDERPESDGFRGAKCAEAGVDRMEWKLVRAVDGVQVAEGVDFCCRPGRVCDESIDWVLISDPAPGDYTLDITGYDEADQPRWGTRCDGLYVTRFDRGYSCDVPGPPQ